jgi:hypothetical protein
MMAIRVSDFARGYVTGVTRVVVIAPGDIDLRALLQVPEAVEYTDVGADGKLEVSAESLGVLALEKDIDPEATAAALSQVQDGGTVLLLLGWSILDLPWHRVLDVAVSADLQVVDVVTVAARRYPTAAVLRRAERLVVPPPHLGSGHHAPTTVEADDAAARRLALRIAGELAFVGLRERRLRVVVDETREALRLKNQELAAANKELERSRAELQSEHSRVKKTEARLENVQGSPSLQLGQALEEARSLRGLVRLPVRVVRIRRQRRRQRSAS